MRKLASIQIVTKIEPIQNADSIEVATILGWQVVCKIGELKVGELVVYSEIDSLLPDIDLFEEIKKITNGTLRIRTIRMRGQVSQGICFPVSIVEHFGLLPEDMIVGQDVTTAMGITKYEDEIPSELLGKAKGYMPSDIPKSDIVRVQTAQEVLDKYEGTLCYETEKLDGESVTFYLKNDVFGVCSKVVDFIESDDVVHWRLAKEIGMEEKLRTLCKLYLLDSISLQGEIVGEGIKKNKYKLTGKHVFFYNVFDINKHCYFNYIDFVAALYTVELKSVPVITDKLVLPNNIQDLVARSNGRSILYDTKREGVVIVPLVEINDIIGRVIFKVISPDFLIKHGE